MGNKCRSTAHPLPPRSWPLLFARLVAVPPHPSPSSCSQIESPLRVFGTDQSEHDVCPSDHSANVSHLDWGCISARSDWSLSRASTRHPALWRAASASQHRSLETAATLPPRYMLAWLHSCNLIVLRLTALALIHYVLASAAQCRQAATNRIAHKPKHCIHPHSSLASSLLHSGCLCVTCTDADGMRGSYGSTGTRCATSPSVARPLRLSQGTHLRVALRIRSSPHAHDMHPAFASSSVYTACLRHGSSLRPGLQSLQE